MRIKKIISFFIALLKSKSLLIVLYMLGIEHGCPYASFELKGNSARIQAMGQAFIGLANTSDAIFINCSGLAQLTYPAFSVFYTKPFGMKELSYGSFSAALPTNIGTFATGLISFGNELYSEQSLLLSINRAVNQNCFYGCNLHYMKLQISGYGSDFALGIDIGLLAKISSRVSWGFFTTNMNRARLGQNYEPLPQTLGTGISVCPTNDLVFNVDIYKDSLFPVEFRCGVEYRLLNRIALRSGFSTEPSQFCAGFGLLFSRIEIDYAVTTHQTLGLSHHFSLQIQFKSNKKNVILHQTHYDNVHLIKTKININTASIIELQKIPGIGPTLAKRIIAYREQNIRFNSLDELCQVKGINKSRLESIKPFVTLDNQD